MAEKTLFLAKFEKRKDALRREPNLKNLTAFRDSQDDAAYGILEQATKSPVLVEGDEWAIADTHDKNGVAHKVKTEALEFVAISKAGLDAARTISKSDEYTAANAAISDKITFGAMLQNQMETLVNSGVDDALRSFTESYRRNYKTRQLGIS